MLVKLIPSLGRKTVVLASGSPRRRELLSSICLTFSVVSSNFAEDLDKSQFAGRPEAYVQETARLKGLDVLSRLTNENPKPPDLVIACDTVVTLDGVIIEKPASPVNAAQILRKLSGRQHGVYTGVALFAQTKSSPDVVLFFERTDVEFGDLTDAAIDAYVATGEPMDKAGAYGIQGMGAILVKRISGDFYNVVGLPVYKLTQELVKLFNM